MAMFKTTGGCALLLEVDCDVSLIEEWTKINRGWGRLNQNLHLTLGFFGRDVAESRAKKCAKKSQELMRRFGELGFVRAVGPFRRFGNQIARCVEIDPEFQTLWTELKKGGFIKSEYGYNPHLSYAPVLEGPEHLECDDDHMFLPRKVSFKWGPAFFSVKARRQSEEVLLRNGFGLT